MGGRNGNSFRIRENRLVFEVNGGGVERYESSQSLRDIEVDREYMYEFAQEHLEAEYTNELALFDSEGYKKYLGAFFVRFGYKKQKTISNLVKERILAKKKESTDYFDRVKQDLVSKENVLTREEFQGVLDDIGVRSGKNLELLRKLKLQGLLDENSNDIQKGFELLAAGPLGLGVLGGARVAEVLKGKLKDVKWQEAKEVKRKGKKEVAKVKTAFESRIQREELKTKLGKDFQKVLDFAKGVSAEGEIQMSDLKAGLVLSDALKTSFGDKVREGLGRIEDGEWKKIQKIFDKHYTTGKLAVFKKNYTEFMIMVAVANLEGKLKDVPYLEEFSTSKDGNSVVLDYTVTGLVANVVVRGTGNAGSKYSELVTTKKAEAAAAQSADQAKTAADKLVADKKAMKDAIKKAGGLPAILFALFGGMKDENDVTLADKLFNGDSPMFAAMLGLKGVKFGPFEEMAATIRDSAKEHPKFEKLLGKFEKAIGVKSGEIASNVKALVGADFTKWLDGGMPLTTAVALAKGYTAKKGKTMKLTLPKGKALLLPEGEHMVSTKFGQLKKITVKKGETKDFKPAANQDFVYVQKLVGKSIIPAGTTSELIDAHS